MFNSYKEELSRNNNNKNLVNHTYKCPGIYEITHKGFLILMPWDITLYSNPNEDFFHWSSPSSHVCMEFIEGQKIELASLHQKDKTAQHIVQKPGYMKSIVKLTLPWHVISSQPTKLLFMPIPYPDVYTFEHTFGILDTSITSFINAHVFMRTIEGQIIIKAGTPLMQIIPLEEQSINLHVEYKSLEDINSARSAYLTP